MRTCKECLAFKEGVGCRICGSRVEKDTEACDFIDNVTKEKVKKLESVRNLVETTASLLRK